MAATQKLYPRATVKRVVKAHSNRNVSKNADILVSCDPETLVNYYHVHSETDVFVFTV